MFHKWYNIDTSEIVVEKAMKLKEIADVVPGNFIKSSKLGDVGRYIYLQPKDIDEYDKIYTDKADRIADMQIKRPNYVDVGGILFRANGRTFRAAEVANDAAELMLFHPNFFHIRFKPEADVASSYIVLLLNSRSGQQYFHENRSSASLKVVTKPVIENFELTLPSIEEQRHWVAKYADFQRKVGNLKRDIAWAEIEFYSDLEKSFKC